MSDDLDALALDDITARGCSHPDCTDHSTHGPLYFHAACHPAARMEVSYVHGDGFLLIACAECHKTVAKVVIAS